MNSNLISRLSTDSAHHFFGYYGICPWDSTNRFHLALQTGFHERAPTSSDAAEVGLIDERDGSFRPLAKTRAFNLQQGSMLHWIDAGFGEEFTFNDWEGDRLVSRAVHPKTGAQRTLESAIAAVSPTEPLALGLNFARMFACRPVVGYANEYYHPEDLAPLPEDDGLSRIDLRTGRSELIVSFPEVHRLLPQAGTERQPHWFNHVVVNPDGTRLLFFCRIKQSGPWLNSIWTVGMDGKGLRCLIPYGHKVSHFAWIDPDTVMISGNTLGAMQFMSLKTSSGVATEMRIEDFPADGHNAFSPDFRWIVCDTYPEKPKRECRLLLHNRSTQQTVKLGSFAHPEHIRGDWRCDLHPRWSHDGRKITFDSVHEGSRQIYAVDVSSIVVG